VPWNLWDLRSKKEKVLIIKSLNMMNFPDLQPALLTVDGKNGEVKRPYLRKILKVLRDYEDELKALQGE